VLFLIKKPCLRATHRQAPTKVDGSGSPFVEDVQTKLMKNGVPQHFL